MPRTKARRRPSASPRNLGTSAVLPGTHLSVSPLPDSMDASYDTQISLLGYPISELSSISVSGSQSGRPLGAAWRPTPKATAPAGCPRRLSTRARRWSCTASWCSRGKSYPFAFHFTTAVRDAFGHPASSPKPAGKPAELFSFHSQPNLHVPLVTVDSSSARQTAGDLFMAPYSGPGQDGPMIVDSSGNLVWFDPLPFGTEATNLQVQSYEGKPVLTWWQGYIPPQGFGQGEEVIANTSYQQIMKFKAGNGLLADLHDFDITPQNTAFLTSFTPIRCNLTSVGGPSDAAVTDSLLQEIDLKTHLVRREWHPLDHVALSQSYASATSSSQEWPFDYFHLNSIAVRHDGSLLISARNTSALYELSPSSGQIIAQIGGKHGTEKLGAGAATAYQHDAEELPDGDFTVFDNGAVPKVHSQSRGLVLAVNQASKTDTVVGQYEHSSPLSAGSQGNVQPLEDGDMFIGWGAEPYFSEYAPTGALLFDAHLPRTTESYRTYRFAWSATPTGAPAIATSAGRSSTTVYASWNGATTVASWNVLTGPSATQLTTVASAAKTGFETSISVPGTPGYVLVQALGASGEVLANSHAIKG